MPANSAYTCGVLTLSDKGAQGLREDTSGPMLIDLLENAGFTNTAYAILADNFESIRQTLIEWSDIKKIDLIVTTGGTGVSPTDITPEATGEVLDREIPGISEAMRLESLKLTSRAMLSRGKCGIRGESLILNLPGSRKAAKENIEAVLGTLPHAIEKIKGGTADCGG